MSYLVLARKYRPQTFAEIVGQEHVTRTLTNALAQGRVHHAFLFCGPRGVGKTTAARVLAKALCCEQGPTPAPCGTCAACTTITAGNAVDYLEIDGASNNSVDNIRELREGVRYQPAQLRRRIYVIDEVHMLTTAAFNALLKTLEEPPPHVTFVFATTEVHKIPITIVSRCQRYDFKLLSRVQLVTQLEKIFAAEEIKAETAAIQLLARESGGSVRDMLSMADQVIAFVGNEVIAEAKVAEVLGIADRALMEALLGGVVHRDGAQVLQTLDAAVTRGVDLGHMARRFLGLLRDLAVVQTVGNPTGLIDATADEVGVLRELGRHVARVQLLWLMERFARTCEVLVHAQLPRLHLEIALLEMVGSEPAVAVDDLIARLEQLENRLGGMGTACLPTGGVAESGPQPTMVTPNPSAEDARSNARGDGSPQRDILAEWEKVIVALEKRSLSLAGIYAYAVVRCWDDRGLELEFAQDSIQAALAADGENIVKLQEFLTGLLGRTVTVRVRLTDGQKQQHVQQTVAELQHTRAQATKQQHEEEARSHPVTQAVLNLFGAEIQEIKSYG